jgi:hypothetical protein
MSPPATFARSGDMSTSADFEKDENVALTSPSPWTTTSTVFRRPVRVTFEVPEAILQA